MEGSAGAPRNGRSIAIVDDDGDVRSLLEAFLSRDGYEIASLANGGELLRRLGPEASALGRAPELIVLDVRMPGLNGLEVLAILREARLGTPVIIITAFSDRPTHEAAKRLGALAVFEKPFDIEDLRHAIGEALASHDPR